MNGKIGLVAYKYPPTSGTGHDTKAENVIVKDMTLALARGFTSSIVLAKKTRKIENMAMNLALSRTAEMIAGIMKPLGDSMRVTMLRKPHK